VVAYRTSSCSGRGKFIGFPDTARKLSITAPTIVPSEVVLFLRGAPAIFVVIAEGLPPGLPPDKQDHLINQLIQIEDEREHLDQFEMVAMVALLMVVC
jgi:uncharacterized protein YjeT (DUF2065 family)